METTNSRELALVTGASSGIGYELAAVFAKEGYDLIIVSETDEILSAANGLRAFGGNVFPVRADLTEFQGVHALLEQIGAQERPLAAAALNAGIGHGGKFAETELMAELDVIKLNVISTVHLAKHIVQGMKQDRHGGKILFTASIAATLPGSYSAVYNASKAFVHSFAEALHYELKEYGISVTALMPGPTDTNFFHRAGMDDTKAAVSEKDDPAIVARQGFDALMAGKDQIIAGSFKTKAMNMGNDLLPESVKAKMHADMAKPGSASGVSTKARE
ncbi:SDR family oxidoreductase [Asticcacaulis sp. YBE204]|uniref:SDR family NAD(P)-dependent oxidoreductase n=1 Tax=Asticcacaulis sp. YBE204 TaxID=1282363 RepID=UPI0003C40FD0|nr:SDR family NAD(P)-dependent oxidoreductase [Asticcacaulis sp. YBE204]ESQ78730.1 hypothetical protein AEYBE204_12150 [Asticcacaulis sp. YBE204]